MLRFMSAVVRCKATMPQIEFVNGFHLFVKCVVFIWRIIAKQVVRW